MAYSKTLSDKIFTVFNTLFLLIIILVTLYPFIYLLAVSLSNAEAMLGNRVSIVPVGFSIEAYRQVFENPDLLNAYKNTIVYTISGTLFNVLFTTLLAYPLSKRRLIGRKSVIFLAVFTLIFSGGMIPSFLVVKGFGLYNTIWALILPGAVSVYFGMILRVHFEQLPFELEEAAMIDGMGTMGILLKVYIPLSFPIYAALLLFFSVGHWNSFFSALIYMKDKESYPVQMILTEMVRSGALQESSMDMDDEYVISESIKAATIMVVTLPILCVYPFIQKYFVKGMMIGSLKG